MLSLKDDDFMIKVSVLVPTYNHERYIAVCLESILSQKTNFEFEILIGEDDSSDGTREIVRKYERDYPSRIKAFYNDRKNVSYLDGEPTGAANFVNLLKNASGKYVALCEGDDYWIDTSKLQKQVEFLESNIDFSICFHDAIWKNGTKELCLYSQMEDALRSGKEYFELQDLFKINFIPSASVVFRNKLFMELPDWYFKFPFGDWTLHILNAIHGKIKYIDDPMSVYRLHNSSSWSSKTKEYRYSAIVRFQFFINKYFKYTFDDVIQEGIIKQYDALIKESKTLEKEIAIKSQKELLALLRRIMEKKIVIFGCGSGGQKIVRQLPIIVNCFLDNDPLKWGQEILGIVIKNPLEMLEEERDNLAILVCSVHGCKIAEQLKQMGFEENYHFWNLYSDYMWLFN